MSLKITKPKWLGSRDIKPYVFVRQENRALHPGTKHRFEWFKNNYLLIDPLKVASADFGHAIMQLDSQAFGKQQMVTPPWVFYDCGVLPGIIAGFAARTENLPLRIRKKLNVNSKLEWTPISMFICIPTVQSNTWMAHNLASVNSILDKKDNYKHLGFLTKAFGLWYANIERLYGVTQWHSPALKIHPNYGEFHLITTYTPLHDYPSSVTYCCFIDSSVWPQVVDKDYKNNFFKKKFKKFDTLNPADEKALKLLQKRLESNKEKIYLSGEELYKSQIGNAINLYRKIKK